jgi:hypothetical protein
MFTPLEISALDRGLSVKTSASCKKARVRNPVHSKGVYSNRLDQAGLDSPPFDDVKPL